MQPQRIGEAIPITNPYSVYMVLLSQNSRTGRLLERVEEAKKRDHNIIGRQLGYFTTCRLYWTGLTYFVTKRCPRDSAVSTFCGRWRRTSRILLTKTPFLAKSDLYKISGHWDHYRDGMLYWEKRKRAKKHLRCVQWHVRSNSKCI